MKKLSRMLALVMALVLALGCMQAVATAEELPEVDLIYWCGANPDQKDAELVLGEMKKVAKDALNVNLDMVIVATSEFKEKFNKAMAAQERVDLTWTGYNPVHSGAGQSGRAHAPRRSDGRVRQGSDRVAGRAPAGRA